MCSASAHAPSCHSGRDRKFIIVGVSPSGKASAFGADIRRFESCHPSQQKEASLAEAFFVELDGGFEATRSRFDDKRKAGVRTPVNASE